VHGRVREANGSILLPLEERWYQQDAQEAGSRQFVVADPDGYLLRLVQSLGHRPASEHRI
ncbi:MAG: glyoxalase, partial [Deinococcus sp.]|nr:glyoxalase [Deinococcus sp.]